MSVYLDKSLDDIIKESGPRGHKTNRRGGNSGNQSNRNSPYARRDGGVQKRGGNKQNQNQNQNQAQMTAQSMMFNPAAFLAAAQQQNQSSGKIIVSNLDYGVTADDLRTLFSQVGPVSRASLHFGPNGKSKGSGEITFKNAVHATMAVEKYHGVTLDGRAMRIEVAFNPMAVAPMMIPSMMPGPMMPNVNANTNNRGRKAGGGRSTGNSSNNNNSNAGGNRRNNGRRMGGGGRRNNKSGKEKDSTSVTKESLDADLDSYMNDTENAA
ncbi:hypothetical protein J3B02_001907 [Coemansia erecta]|nr:hypothetical protein J3B02_001907 [Coemansia erecta]KAJ2888904.1 hypothetical protein FB639_000304 [Coemansia asiatica]